MQITNAGSAATRLFSARPTASLVRYIFFRRPNEMFRQWMVGWLKYLARLNTPTFQYRFAGSASFLAARFAVTWNFCLSLGNRLSIFYLVQKDATHLVDRHLRNASGDWFYHGHVSFRAGHDHFECCRVRHGFHPPRFSECFGNARQLGASAAAQSERACRSGQNLRYPYKAMPNGTTPKESG